MVFIKVLGNKNRKKNISLSLIKKGYNLKKKIINIEINFFSKKKINFFFLLKKINLIYIIKNYNKFKIFYNINYNLKNKNINYFKIFLKYFENKPIFIF